MKSADLIGPALDWAVRKIEGPEIKPRIAATVSNAGKHFRIVDDVRYNDRGHEYFVYYSPSTSWSQGGPIIEREKLMIEPLLVGGDWFGNWRSVGLSWEGRTHADMTGPTPLIAAMRCYVASKLGDEVDIPKELQ